MRCLINKNYVFVLSVVPSGIVHYKLWLCHNLTKTIFDCPIPRGGGILVGNYGVHISPILKKLVNSFTL